MDRKQALDILDGMINESKQKESVDSLKELRNKLVEINTGYGQPLRKAIQDVQETLKKGSGVNLAFSEKGKEDMKKVDPKTKLPGVMLDKVATPGMGAGSMGSSGMNLTPGAGNQGGIQKQEMVGGAPNAAPPMLASEKHDGLKRFMQKCMKHMHAKKSMAAMSEKETVAKSHAKGVHNADTTHGPGVSSAGQQARQTAQPRAQQVSRAAHAAKLQELKQMPRANLPKTEKAEESIQKASAATTGHISENQPKQANVSVRMGGMSMGKKEVNKALGGTGAPSTPTSRPDSGFGAVVAKAPPIKPPAPNPKDPAMNPGTIAQKPPTSAYKHKATEFLKQWKNNKPVMKKEDFPKKQADFADKQAPKELDAGGKKAINDPKDQPIKVSGDRPGQANKQTPMGKLK